MKVTDNHFPGDFFPLNQKYSRFEIAPELSFQDGEPGFDQLSSMVFGIIRSQNHFFSIHPTNHLIVPEPRWNNRISIEVFPDEPVNLIGVVTSGHDIALRGLEVVTLFE